MSLLGLFTAARPDIFGSVDIGMRLVSLRATPKVRLITAVALLTVAHWEPVRLVLRGSDKLHQDSCPCRLTSDHLAQLPERPTVRTRLISHSMGEHDPRSEVWDYVAVYPSGAIWDNNPPSARYQGRQLLRSKMQRANEVARASAGAEAGI